MTDRETGSEQTDSEEFDLEAVSEQLTDEYIHLFSQIFERDLTTEVDDDQRQNAVEGVEDLLGDWVEIAESEADDDEIWPLMLDQFNDVSNEILGGDNTGDNPIEAFVGNYEEIDKVIENVRTVHEHFGCPQYYDCIRKISEDLVESGKASEFASDVEGVLLDNGEILLQRVIGRYEEKVELILDNPEVEDAETARLYLREYERECEMFKKTIPFLLFAVELLEGRECELKDIMDKRLGNYIGMVSAKKRSRINLLAKPVDNDYRNSIAHDDYLVDPIDNQVTLMDGEETVEELSFTEIRDLLVEMFCLTQSLFLFYTFVRHDQNYTALKKLEEEW